MSYKALYRKYRPTSFSSVVGQKHIVETLKNAIKLNQISHAYLFTGPRGTGKTSIAKIFANTLNCPNLSSDLEPCFNCPVCNSLKNNNNQDILELDAASNNSADDIRALRDTLRFLPTLSKYKIYIIDEVHMLSNAAFNALLKTLEEPPKYVIFILATTEVHKLPNTILSRVQRFDFKSITEEDIKSRLSYICKEEGISIDDSALKRIARDATGGLRDALSLLDQVRSYIGTGTISLSSVLDITGSLSEEDLKDFLDLIISNDYVSSFKLVDDLISKGKDVNRLLLEFIGFIKDLLIYKKTSINNFSFLSNDLLDKYLNIDDSLLFKIINNLNETLNNMRFSIHKRSFIDCFILSCCTNSNKLENNIKKVENVSKIESLDNLNIKNSVSTSLNENTSYIDKNDIVNILNNPNKNLRLGLLEHKNKNFNKILEHNNLNIAISAFNTSDLVCATDDYFISVVDTKRDSNIIMKDESYYEILTFFKEYNDEIRGFFCLDKALWQSITKKYRTCLEDGNCFNLEGINILIPKPKELKVVDKKIEFLKNNFNDKLEILED